MSKTEAHRKGVLHRAVSILIFNSKGDFLLQKRADTKYHSAGLWTNTCCSHPYPGETTPDAANRRLMEEMGIACQLREMFSFTYHAAFPNGMIEHELDIVYFGEYESDPDINTIEASDYRWIQSKELFRDVSRNPGHYTVWFRIILEKLETGH